MKLIHGMGIFVCASKFEWRTNVQQQTCKMVWSFLFILKKKPYFQEALEEKF